MSAEAIARLRTRTESHAVNPKHLGHMHEVERGQCETCDVRALLAAYDEMREAAKVAHEHLVLLYGDKGDWMVETLGAVLAKAGGK
jgi:hypothetical protein